MLGHLTLKNEEMLAWYSKNKQKFLAL